MNLFDSIDKPTLLLNRETARRNIQRMCRKAEQAGVRFRPHFKTHQSAQVGEWFRRQGVRAITVSSLEMAQYFARHGWEDILIAFSVNLRQLEALAQLAHRLRLGLLFESVESVQGADRRLQAVADAWIKIDSGAARTGIHWQDVETVRQVAAALQESSSLKLRGLLTHAGHTYHATSPQQICQTYHESVARMNDLRDGLNTCGIAALEVSVGDTPGCSCCNDLGKVDEVRPGNFVFFDAQMLRLGVCKPDDIAVGVACPVVALHPQRQEVVIYGGAVHLAKDHFDLNGTPAYGLVALPRGDGWGDFLEGAYVRGLSQEHGILRMKPEHIQRIRLGDLIIVIPAHSCLTVHCLRRYRTLQGEEIATLNV